MKIKKYNKILHCRVDEATLGWYKDFAVLEGVSLSELVRSIPARYDELDHEVDKLATELDEVEKAHAFKIMIPDSWKIKDDDIEDII